MCKDSFHSLAVIFFTAGFLGCAGQSQAPHSLIGQANSGATMGGQASQLPGFPTTPSAFGHPSQPKASSWDKVTDPIKHNPVNDSIKRSWQGLQKIVQPAKTPASEVISSPLSLSSPTKAPTPELYISMGLLAEKYGNIDQARLHYEKAVEVAPNDVETLLAFGHLEDRQGRLDEALKYYDRAVRTDPKNATALNDLGLCLARKDDMPAAAQALSQAVQLQPNRELYRNNLATVFLELDRPDEAFAQLSAVHPPAVAHYNMGYLLNRRGDLDKATEHFATATQIDPSMQAAQTWLAKLQSPENSAGMAQQKNPDSTPGAQAQQVFVDRIPYDTTRDFKQAGPLPQILGPQNEVISTDAGRSGSDWNSPTPSSDPQLVSAGIPATPPVPQYAPNYPTYRQQQVFIGDSSGIATPNGTVRPENDSPFPDQSPWPLRQPGEVPSTDLGGRGAQPPVPVAVTNVYAIQNPQLQPPVQQAASSTSLGQY
ncbi:MAG: tetratricopeptide repeat protein [Pirellulales bacterium]|nr:tetratricopeptide repeat protein [Pirellulales bacterium]